MMIETDGAAGTAPWRISAWFISTAATDEAMEGHGEKQQYLFVTLVTHMNRLSTRGNLYRMSVFPEVKQVATNNPANDLPLREC
jgi:hypothetical protein